MVSNLSDSGDRSEQQEPNRVFVNHNIEPDTIRNLIKEALGPLPIDPVPTRIVLDKIIVTKTLGGNLGLSCDVYSESTLNQ